MVAEVDATNRRILCEKFKASEQMLFLSDIEKHGKISDEARLQALAIMSKFIDATTDMGVQQTAAIATQAFRQAQNGQEVVDYFTAASVPTAIVSPEDEGRFGFSGALSLSGSAPDKLVAWDCGAGSFQFTSEKFEHADNHGSGTVRKLASSLLNPGQPFQAVHVETINRQLHAQLKGFPPWMVRQDNEFIAIGTGQSIFNQQRILGGSARFTVEDVISTIKSLLGLDNASLLAKEMEGVARLGPAAQYTVKQENAEYILPKLILLLSVMQKAGIPQVRFFETLGNCSALLVHNSLWDKIQPAPIASSAAASVMLGDKERAKPFLTINWHLEKDCNYKCKFCYAHFANTPANLSQIDGFKLLDAMKNFGIYKVNFAGGEPLLNKNLGPYLRHAKELGLHTSIITNASLLTLSWLREFGGFIDQLGISCDSLDDQVNKEMGRGFGFHVPSVARAFERVATLNANGFKIQAKLNTVVMRQTFREDWSSFILKHRIRRWKIFKVLRIEGENDKCYDDISLSDEQFQQFVDRHKLLEQHGVILAPEDNEDMTETYLMVSPDGKFFQNAGGAYQHSAPILSCGMESGLAQIKFDYSKYQRRGGVYAL